MGAGYIEIHIKEVAGGGCYYQRLKFPNYNDSRQTMGNEDIRFER